jgi:WD40 repeat protein
MSNKIHQILSVLAFVALQPLCVRAQDTVWVRKNAPTKKETYSVCWSQDGSRIFSGSECSPSYLRIFSATTGDVQWNYELGSSLMCVSGVKLSSDGTKAAALEELGNLLIFDYSGSTPSLISTIPTGTSGAFALDFSPDGSRIVTACTEKKVNIYRVTDGSLQYSFTATGTWVMSVDWSKDGKYIVTGGNDNAIKVWDTTGTLLRTLTGHTGAVQSVKISDDGQYIVSGSRDDKIKIWELATGNLVRTISGHRSDVMQVDISDDGTFIASGGADSTIRTWRTADGNPIATFGIHDAGKVFTVAIGPDGTHLAAGTANGDVQLWDLNAITAIPVSAFSQTAFSVSPNPCHNLLTIATAAPVAYITICNMQGQQTLLQRTEKLQTTVDVSALSSGWYSVSITTENGIRQSSTFYKN